MGLGRFLRKLGRKTRLLWTVWPDIQRLDALIDDPNATMADVRPLAKRIFKEFEYFFHPSHRR